MKKIPSLKLKHITKTFTEGTETVTVLKDINLAVSPGEFVSLIIPSDSEKSTFLAIAGGLLVPDNGEVWLNQTNITFLEEKKRSEWRQKEIGFILQQDNLIPFLTISDQFKLIDTLEKRPFSENHLRKFLTFFDLLALIKKMPKELSKEQQKKVALAKAFYHEPSLILADEPTATLTTSQALELIKLLAKRTHQQKTATIMLTKDSRMVSYSQHVFTLIDGHLTLQTKRS